MNQFPYSLDVPVFRFVNGTLTNPVLDVFFRTITDFGFFEIPLIIGAVVVLYFAKWPLRYHVVLAILALIFADMMGQNLKIGIDRLRPYWVLDGVHFPDGMATSRSPSFPSNHAANSFAVCSVFAWYFRRRIGVAVAFLGVAMLVAYSRVYVGVHWPSDVIGGGALGMATAGLLIALNRWVPVVQFREGQSPIFCWQGLTALLLIFVYAYRYSFALRAPIPLASEEAQYWDWSRHLDWSYYSKPPLIAYAIRLFTMLFGDTEFAVRGVAVTFSLGTALVTWRFTQELFQSARTNFITQVVLTVTPLFFVGSVITTTDTPMMFFWAATCLALYRATLGNQSRMWLVAAVACGLGILSKYAMLYIFPCLAVLFWLVPGQRRHLKTAGPWVFVLGSLLFFLPVLYWNYLNDWISFRHVAGQAGSDKGFRWDFRWFLEYIGSQAMVVSPFAFLAMAYFTYRFLRTKKRVADPKSGYLVSMGAPVFIIVLGLSLKNEILANWAAPAYFTGMLFAVHMYERELMLRWDQRKWRNRLLLYGGLGILIPLGAFLLFHEKDIYRDIRRTFAAMGIPLQRQADPQYQFVGNDDLGEMASELAEDFEDGATVFFFSKSYHDAALLAFYAEGQPRTYCINDGKRRMNQYDIWGIPGEDLKGWNAIYVTKGDGERMKPPLSLSFESVDRPDYLKVKVDEVEYKRYTLYKCHGFVGEFHGVVREATKY